MLPGGRFTVDYDHEGFLKKQERKEAPEGKLENKALGEGKREV